MKTRTYVLARNGQVAQVTEVTSTEQTTEFRHHLVASAGVGPSDYKTWQDSVLKRYEGDQFSKDRHWINGEESAFPPHYYDLRDLPF